jgi:hypothetical protein
MRSWIVRCMQPHLLLASMAQCDRSDWRPDVLAVLRPLPPHPHHQDDDIQSDEEPNQEHRLQPSKWRRESMPRCWPVWEGQALDGWR